MDFVSFRKLIIYDPCLFFPSLGLLINAPIIGHPAPWEDPRQIQLYKLSGLSGRFERLFCPGGGGNGGGLVSKSLAPQGKHGTVALYPKSDNSVQLFC